MSAHSLLWGARLAGGYEAARATVNRDLVAVAAFLRWCEKVKELTVPRVTLSGVANREAEVVQVLLKAVEA